MSNARSTAAIAINDLILPSFMFVLFTLASWSLNNSACSDGSIMFWCVGIALAVSYRSGMNIGSINYSTAAATAALPRYGFINKLQLILLRGSIPA